MCVCVCVCLLQRCREATSQWLIVVCFLPTVVCCFVLYPPPHQAALAKVQATKTFAYCAKEAAMLHGGNSYVKGNRIESLYRHVLSLAIPGGSEDVMLDAAARLSLKGRL